MRIQHNISALNTHRNLASNTNATSKSLEKLSSGFKINRAGDDAAGLAISEKMRGQIRGLDMASKNANDGISLIQTTEGALNETHSILQRMRELAVQAGNDTNTADDRGEIQKEINQLTSEINRIGNTTEFNTKKLLNGELSDSYSKSANVVTTTKMAVAGQEILVGDAAASWNSGEAAVTFDISFSGKTDSQIQWSAAAQAVSAAVAPAFSIERTTAGFALNATITNSATSSSTVITSAALSYDADSDTYSFDGQGIKLSFKGSEATEWSVGEKLTIDLKKVKPDGYGKVSTNPTEQGWSTNSGATATAVGATLTNFKIASTGSNLEGLAQVKVTFDNDATAQLTVDLQDSAGNSLGSYKYESLSAASASISFNQHGVSFDFNTKTATDATGTFKIKNEDKVTVKPPADAVDQSIKFQIGANENQALTVAVNDMRAAALGIVGTAGTEGFTTKNEVNDGTDNTMTEAALDLSNHENAAKAITILDKAINSVSSERAKLGAVQNRLEHTINNLGASSENLTAAESRIRDTDMAASMMDFTKNNILTQAAQSMLAQANQQPQGVLQLLG